MANFADWDALDEPDSMASALRRLRQAVMARLITRDHNGLATLDEVVSTISLLAEFAVQQSLACACRSLPQYGQPIGEDSGEVQQLIVIGMGKLGGGELNVSSDIDLIFIYPEGGETSGPRKISNHEYFSQVGKRIISLINDVTLDGQVFRVDMRLRPYGDSGPLVMSFPALENYLLTQGREWERYAWIKAKALTGDITGLSDMVRPFVYRKYLDYNAYGAMRELHAQIRREVARRDMADNIKLGPGGIREVEFIAQVFQLIRGGRDKACNCAAPAPRWTGWPNCACWNPPPWPSCKRPMPSCAIWNIACNTWTTSKPRPCPPAKKTRPLPPAWALRLA
jgi:glutamate-ammonia-ligase adenylyltransferase